MTLRSISHGPRPSTLPAAPKTPPAMSWAELARAEGHRPRLPASHPNPFSEQALTARAVLAYVRRCGPCHRRQVAKAFNSIDTRVAWHLQALTKAGKLRRIGSGRQSRYEVAP